MLLASITSSITSFVGDHGIYAVFLLMLIDAVFPAASELVMLYGGALAGGAFAQHVTLFGDRISTPAWAYLATALSGTLGYTLGGVLGWGVGAYGGRPLLERHGRWLHLGPEKLDRAEAWFERRGAWAVFLGRLTPVVRSFISIPAGLFRDPFGRYTALTLAGSAIWAFALAGAGWAIGSSWHRVHEDFRYVDVVVLVLVVAVAAWLVLRRMRGRRPRIGAADAEG